MDYSIYAGFYDGVAEKAWVDIVFWLRLQPIEGQTQHRQMSLNFCSLEDPDVLEEDNAELGHTANQILNEFCEVCCICRRYV